MAFCVNCGTKIGEGVKFCSQCGTSVFSDGIGIKQDKDVNVTQAQPSVFPQAIKADEKYCFSCGSIIKKDAEMCTKCGVNQSKRSSSAAIDVYCSSCGKSIKKEAAVCPFCGVSQGNSSSLITSWANNKEQPSIMSFVLGVNGLWAWFFPLIGFPVAILGLIMGIVGQKSSKKRIAFAGLILSIIALVATIINSAIGAYKGATSGQLTDQNLFYIEETADELASAPVSSGSITRAQNRTPSQDGGNMSQNAALVASSVAGAPGLGVSLTVQGFKAANGDMAALVRPSSIEVNHLISFSDQGVLKNIFSLPVMDVGASNVNDFSAAANNMDLSGMQQAISGMFDSMSSTPTTYSSGGNTAKYFDSSHKERKQELEITTAAGRTIVFYYDGDFTRQLYQPSGSGSGASSPAINPSFQNPPSFSNTSAEVCPKCQGSRLCSVNIGIMGRYGCNNGRRECAGCQGMGFTSTYGTTIRCSSCDGVGWSVCSTCRGSGLCNVCNGTGRRL